MATWTSSRARQKVAPVSEVAKRLPGLVGLTPEEYADRITARQQAVARRMIS